MARQEIERYYEPSGREHIVKSEWNFGCYAIYVDGKFYTNADDRFEKRETIDEIVKDNMWLETKPLKKITPIMPASLRTE